VVVLRRRIKHDIAVTARRDDGQMVLALPHDSLENNAKLWEYTVLVTNAEYDIVYNWWSWYVRAANPNARREALTSRPLLLAAVGRATSHSDQTTLYLTPMHAETGLIKSMIANVRAAIRYVRQAAEQLPQIDRWAKLLGYICQRIVGPTAPPTPHPALPA